MSSPSGLWGFLPAFLQYHAATLCLFSSQILTKQPCFSIIGPDEVLIRLNATGLCYSDIHFMRGDLDLSPMSAFGVRSPGHEGAGIIVKLGNNVKNWKVGDRAGTKPVWDICGTCEFCWTGRDAFCAKSLHAGLMKPGSYQVREQSNST
jgi:D-arabinose 1-dehydrogenase-like Zn-dependent alcohol dehydrogenase